MNEKLEKPALIEKLHSETAKIAWSELQKFFAQGSVLLVSAELDLVTTAALIAQDRRAELEPLLTSNKVAAPSNDQAREWFNEGALLWSVVVAPFVLVQQAEK
ncbi:MAG: hypothetical protein ACI9FR_000117 [Cryomorphaceae bacterium]|jgi:hypothetical protein